MSIPLSIQHVVQVTIGLLTSSAGFPRYPLEEVIAKRYLKHRFSLDRQALARLADDDPMEDVPASAPDALEDCLEKPLNLNEQRITAVPAKLSHAGERCRH